jgi:hypothetical protein
VEAKGDDNVLVKGEENRVDGDDDDNDDDNDGEI